MPASLEDIRRRYAEDVCRLAGVAAGPIVEAFAAVPRERFLGPGPWVTIDGDLKRETTPDADPRHLYRNVLIALDDAKQLNNGQPQFWAGMFDRLRLRPGERAIHVGAGGGYYTALLAELVGSAGRVTGIEYEPGLAAGAKRALADRPNVELLSGDAHGLVDGAADVIVASCGFDAVPVAWARLLNEGGRLMLPLTMGSRLPGIGVGAVLLATRRGDAYDAEFVSGTMIYHDKGGRSPQAEAKLAAAFPAPAAGWSPPRLASLRIGGAPDDSCWVAGDGWWLSTAPAP